METHERGLLFCQHQRAAEIHLNRRTRITVAQQKILQLTANIFKGIS